jgi:D-alanyl-D-alanine carboxypeptidase
MPAPGPSRRAAPSPASPTPAPATPRWPAFSATVSGPLTPGDVPFSWRPGCPVPPGQLRAIHLSYAGFDSRPHTGEIIINASVVAQVIKVFRILYRARFPIRRMEPVDVFHGSDPRSMAADNTSGFNCRYADAPGPPQWSMHAYGLAIDVNTVQNPYLEPGFPVQPPAGAAYVDRSDIRLGMAYPGGILVSAFSSVGWGWGGYWAGSPDYQHFSVNGR